MLPTRQLIITHKFFFYFFVGFPAHAAAEAAVLLAQGLAPAGTDPAFFAHYQVNSVADPLPFSWPRVWPLPAQTLPSSLTTR